MNFNYCTFILNIAGVGRPNPLESCNPRTQDNTDLALAQLSTSNMNQTASRASTSNGSQTAELLVSSIDQSASQASTSRSNQTMVKRRLKDFGKRRLLPGNRKEPRRKRVKHVQ